MNSFYRFLGAMFILLMLTSSTQAELPKRPIQDIHNQLLELFTPIDQTNGDVGINHSGEEPFTGDCDDYYTAAFNQLWMYGYDPYAQFLIVKATGEKHIVACVRVDGKTRCLDHTKKQVSNMRDLKNRYYIRERRKP